MSFIQELYKKRSRYGDPDQATMQENSLEKLSSGIYTEGERFVFELLQNAVDAHSSSDRLDISIDIQNGYLVFMHNGDAFTNEDIEGICFVGRKGDKETNTKKLGIKVLDLNRFLEYHQKCISILLTNVLNLTKIIGIYIGIRIGDLNLRIYSNIQCLGR